MLSRWPIRNKLLLGLALLLVIVATLSWSGIHGLYAYRGLVKSLTQRMSELPLANEFIQCVADLRVSLADSRGLHDLYISGEGTSAFGAQMAREEFRMKLDQSHQILRRYREKLSESPDATSIADSRREWETVRSIETTLRRIGELNRDEDWLLDEVKISRLTSELEHLQKLAGEIPTFLHQNIEQFSEEARVQYRTLITLTWSTSACTVVLLALFMNLSYRWIVRPLRVLVKGSRRVAAGEFNYRIRLNSHDEMRELAAAMNDMTDRFQSIRDDLDRQVQERTRQVVRGEQLASVGFLAAGVAHEINNPLASIAMCAESLESRAADIPCATEEERSVLNHYLRMIQTEAFRCKEITERLLDFARLGDSKRQPTELRELVQGVVEMLGHIGKYQNKEVLFTQAPGVVAEVNPQEIKQVVLNLLTNALDSIEGEGRVSIDLEAEEDYAQLTIADTGCGMTEEVLEHLFEPFFTRRQVGQGTGLGLSITYRIVDDHDGRIDVQSQGPGHGSQFRVRLPLTARTKESSYRHQAA